MSTRSVIAGKFSDGTIKAVYVHHDGYGHLPVLEENYSSQEKVEALISRGDLSVLGSSLDACSFYEYDNNSAPTEVDSFEELKDLDWGQEYIYKWDGSSWSQEAVEN